MPVIGEKIQREIDKEVKGILSGVQHDVDERRLELGQVFHTMPEEGLPAEQVLERFRKLHSHYKPGQMSGGVYAEYDDETLRLLREVWGVTALTNPMHSEWPLINLMEAEVISMCSQLLHGEKGTTGIMTHGGSTSILEACKAYVFLAREKGSKNLRLSFQIQCMLRLIKQRKF